MTKVKIALLLGVLIAPMLSLAQFTIDLPINKSVFQRNSAGQATINIAGSYSTKVISSVQARLVTPGTSTPISGFNWTIIDDNPVKGNYYGQLTNVPQGWYTLEVRTVKSGTVISSSSISRVGVGDVFLIFGQSNAQGWEGISGLSVSSDRVITHNYIDPCSISFPSFQSFDKIAIAGNIGQHGITSWYWGNLGDKLVTNNNVPVAFFNGATSGSSTQNFIDSFNGGATTHPFTGSQFCNGVNPANTSGVGTPYTTFLKTMQYYNSMYGVRAVLWMQGESETFLGSGQASYQTRLNSVISRVRSDFGSTIPWVMARTSFYGTYGSSSNVINAQTNLLNTSNQIFQGPFTDNVNNNVTAGTRDTENVHLKGSGLSEIATRWNTSLTSNLYTGNTQNFFQVSNPISANSVPELGYTVSGSNVTVTAPSGYSSYRWVISDSYGSTSVSTSQSITSTGSNTYRCYMTKSNGNLVVSQKVDIAKILSQQSLASTCSGTTYLSNLAPYSLSNGLGPVEFDKSNGSSADGDGTVQSLNTTTYSKGIGVYGNSEVTYRIPSGLYTSFKASIGVDDDVLSGGSVIFKVYGDGNLLYTSPTMNALSSTIDINLALCSYTMLRLVTENAGDGSTNDMANWSNARFTCESTGAPTALSTYKIGSKCLGLNWSAPSSGTAVNYEVYIDGNVVDTVSSDTYTYLFGGLTSSTTYTLGVKSISCSGAKSATSSISAQTNGRLISYSPNFNFICIGDTVMPSVDNPGGTFAIQDGAGMVDYLNATTGAIKLNGTGPVILSYIIDNGTNCYDTSGVYVYAQIKPLPPSISADVDLLNTGDAITLTSNTDCGSYDLIWSNGNTAVSFSTSPADTTQFYAQCKNSFCYSNQSNTITAKVIPDCPDSFYLEKGGANLNYGSRSFDFFAEDQIEALNIINSPTGAIYKAGDNIQLKPGFEVKSGSVFSATIGGCP
ncbi:NPCBM/NEW2 domain-containing protein [Jiulongibacter sp. NS-SX5]|uniref:NPCBM/NEW2 domain-containing protein n=1 Tax=Jiulongibacter sp. NS-SX5 TaxID=3463854 RepID=UPI004058F57E